MSKKVVSSDYLRARGLSEQEITVYSTVLGLGSATIGEISLSIKMELPEIYVQIKQLQEIGYIKQIPGKVPRYIAMEPFLKDYVQLTSEVKLGLLNIQDNFHSDVEEFNTQIKTIVPSLQHQAEREKTEKLAASMEKYDQLQKNLIKLIDKSFLQIKHFANTLTTWPSQCLEKTIPAFEKDLEQSKDQFVSAISNYADSLVIDSREIRDRLEKATIQHKIMVAERLEKLKADIDDAITKLNDDIIKQNYETTSSLGTKLDEKDIAARERAADIITNLVNNVAVLAREKEGDISSETAQMINNSLGPLFKVFDALQNEIKSVLSNVLEKQSQRAATTFRQINQEVDTSIPEVLETITDHLEMSRDESAKFIDQKITDPFKELEKMKGDIGQDIEVFKDNLMQVANKQDEIVKENIAERIQRAEESAELGKVELKDIISLTRIDIEDIIQSLIKNILNENSAKIEKISEITEKAAQKLENTLGNTIYLLDNAGKTFEGIVNMSEKVMPIEELEIEMITGNESIIRSMKDMLLRAQEELILITPTVITDFLLEIEKLPQVTQYQIVSNISGEDIGLLNVLIKRGNLSTMSYKGGDYWVAIRDNEEILFAPRVHKNKNLGFITTNPDYYDMFYEIVDKKIFQEMKTYKVSLD